MKVEEFKPCPWCDTNKHLIFTTPAELHDDPDDFGMEHTVICDATQGGCGASCGFGSSTTHEAFEKWNSQGSKTYTVILIYPDYLADNYGEDFYIGYSSASSPEQAVKLAQSDAVQVCGGLWHDSDPEDFDLVACFQNELHPLLYGGGGKNL